MASIQLDRVWIHDPDDLEVYLALDASEPQVSVAVEGTVSRRAGGRRRAIRTPGVDGVLQVVFDLVTISQREQLDDWVGMVRLVRDPVGRVWFGVWWETSVTELAGTDSLCNVAVAIQRTTGTVAV